MYQYAAAEFAIPEATRLETTTGSLAEVLGALSYALDMTEGQPRGHSIRACWIGTFVALAAGMREQALRDCYYAVLMKDLGCSSNAARVAELFLGDDRQLKHAFKLLGPDAADFVTFIEHSVGQSAPADQRCDAIGVLLADAGPILNGFIETRCSQGATIARRLRFSEEVALGIAALDEHWDGQGMPNGTAGEAIPLIARVALLAQVADVFFMVGGRELARAEVAARSGTWLDPTLVTLFLELGEDASFWEALVAPDLEQCVFALEPGCCTVAFDDDYLDDIAVAFGQVIDAKSPYTGGHSARVADVARAIADEVGIEPSEARRLWRAAILHDIGKLGVSNRVLDKPGKLDDAEWVEMRHHAALSTEILSRVTAMHDLAVVAGSHHERLDGRGYPLGLDWRTISVATRIITVADIFDALTADRPYRAAMPLSEAFAILDAETGDVVDATIVAALKSVVASGRFGGLPTALR